MKTKVLLCAAAAAALSACASSTERYGRLAPVSSAEAAALDCEAIDAELAHIAGFLAQVGERNRWWPSRDVAAMPVGDAPREEALASAETRREQLSALRERNRCTNQPPGLRGTLAL